MKFDENMVNSKPMEGDICVRYVPGTGPGKGRIALLFHLKGGPLRQGHSLLGSDKEAVRTDLSGLLTSLDGNILSTRMFTQVPSRGMSR